MQRAYYKQNRIKQLRAFCYTAQTGSMSRAAEFMKLSQPTVSLLIQALEQDIGHKLFRRRGPRTDITHEGRNLLELALPLVEGLEALPAALDERLNQRISGQLRIAASESALLYLLPETLAAFNGLYPHVALRLSNVAAPGGLARLLAGEVDFMVGSMVKIPDEIIYTPLNIYDPVLIMPPDHVLAGRKSINLAEISHYPLVLPPPHLPSRQIIDLAFSQQNLEYEVVLEVGGWEVIKHYVRANLGIAIVTSICLQDGDHLASQSLGHLLPQRSYGLVQRRGKTPAPAARRFIELLTANVQYVSGQLSTGTRPLRASQNK